ncbi:MAG: phosphotransferase [Thermomicrobiales bacterium]
MKEHRLEFVDSEHPWSPTAVVEEINALTGSALELVALDEQTGGTSGAAYVRWPDGREWALTRTDIPLGWMRRTAEILSRLRSQGLPVPRHDLVISLADGYLAVVQERMPGRPPTWVNADRVEAMVRANERFAGLLADCWDGAILPDATTSASEDAHHRYAALEAYSDRSRHLLRRIREIERNAPTDLPNGDLVHPDYGLGNVLFDASGTISGIVDWNGGAWCGDHRFALLKLVLNIKAEGDQYGVQQEARDHLDEIVRGSIERDVLRLYWARWTSIKVAHAIREGFSSHRIDEELRLGEDRLS